MSVSNILDYPNGKVLRHVCNSIRFDIGETQIEHTISNSKEALTTLEEELRRRSSPESIIFPGDKDSFIQASISGVSFPRIYTISLWIKLEESSSARGFLLFRCRSPGGGIDVILSDRTSEGEWTITIRTFQENGMSGLSKKHEVRGKIKLKADQWQLLTLQQFDSETDPNKVLFHIDGNLELEDRLPYPFLAQENAVQDQGSQWVFGLGMKGSLSSVTMYGDDLGKNTIRWLHSIGRPQPGLPTSPTTSPW